MAATTEGPNQVKSGYARRLALAGGLVLVLAAVTVGALYSQQRAKAMARAQAVRLMVAERKFDEARTLIDAWIAGRPDDGEPYYLRAKIEVAANRPDAALAAMRLAVQHGFGDEPINVLRAVLMARVGEADAAEPVLRRALDSSTESQPEVAEALARIYLSSFRLSQAAGALERWMKDDPAAGRPYLWRNEIDQRIDAEAPVLIRNYRMALQRDPSLDKARLGLADKLRETQRSDEAEAEYAAYLKRNPKGVEGHIGSGQTSLQKGDLAAAIRHFEDALAIDPNEVTALRELALIDVRQGQFRRACGRLEKVVKIDPFDPELRANYSRALKMAGDEASAREQSAAAERLRNEHREMNVIRLALVDKPGDLALRFDAARWLLEHGHESEALEWFKLILGKQPGHAPTCALLADYYRKTGNPGLSNYYKLAASQAASTAGK